MVAICSTLDWKMRSVASPATLEPRNLGFVVAQLTLEAFVVLVLLFHHFDHWQQVGHVYIERQDAFGIHVFYYALYGWEQVSVHGAVTAGFGFAGVERAQDRLRHDA
jgi:hypothetical protein